MAKTSLLRTVWSSRFMGNLDNYLVFGSDYITNKFYEGDAATANVVRINQMGKVQVGTYAGTQISIQPITSSNADLTLNQHKYFDVLVDDIDKYQSQLPLMENVMERAAYSVGDTIDSYIAQTVLLNNVASASATGVSGSAIVATGSTAINNLIECGTTLSNAGVPLQGRYAVVSPGYVGALQKQFSTLGYDLSTIHNGLLPGVQVAGFQLFISQNLKTYGSGASTEYVCYAGHPMCATFAVGLREMESMRHPDYFGDVIKGLVSYGGIVTNPTGIVQTVVKFA